LKAKSTCKMKSILLLLFLAASQIVSAQQNTSRAYIAPEDLHSWLGYLASDDMKGRMNGSVEMEEAAKWIASKYKEYGVKAFDGYENYLQAYTFSGRRGGEYNERNVIGYIPGNDPQLKDEYIIISAHFDHVGIGREIEGDSIYNGADDNAAGTATLIGIAKAIYLSGKEPGRTIVFAAVSGEEMGLHGSRYFVKNPLIDLAKAYANINFEMTGHSEELGKGSYYMTGYAYSNLDDLIQEFGRDKDIQLVDTMEVVNTRYFFMSDNIAFSRIRTDDNISIGIPSGTFATTTSGSHIHRPSDELELFDLENMSDLVNYFSEMILWLSYCEEEVTWTDDRFKRLK